MDKSVQTYFPWGDGGAAVPADAVAAVLEGVPEHAEAVTPQAAAKVLGCSRATIYKRIQAGVLLVRNTNALPDAEREHYRVIVRIDRPFDPNRKGLMSLDEAAKIFSNVDG